MKPIQIILFVCMIAVSFSRCGKACDKSLRIGEIVQIPVKFVGFGISEIDMIKVYRVDKSNTNSRDTFYMSEILWGGRVQSLDEIMTDKVPTKAQNTNGDYGSSLDNCDLILDWYTGRDTFANFVVKKSRAKIKGCHENDPNVRIDQFSFVHKGKVVAKNEGVVVSK